MCLDGKSGIGASRLITAPLAPYAIGLTLCNHVATVCVRARVSAGGKALPGQSPKQSTSVYPKGVGGDKPAWLAFDRQVSTSYSISGPVCVGACGMCYDVGCCVCISVGECCVYSKDQLYFTIMATKPSGLVVM